MPHAQTTTPAVTSTIRSPCLPLFPLAFRARRPSLSRATAWVVLACCLAAWSALFPPATAAAPTSGAGQTGRELAAPDALRALDTSSLLATQPLAPFMEFLVDSTGTSSVDELLSSSHRTGFTPLGNGLPLFRSGSVWLRLTLALRPADGQNRQLLLDLGPDLPGPATLFLPARNQAGEWRPHPPGSGNIFLLPDPVGTPVPVYVKLDGVPGPWFAPILRTPRNAAANNDVLARPLVIGVLVVVLALCLLRGVFERSEWRLWASLFAAAVLTQAMAGQPPTPSGYVPLRGLPGVLAPGLALMLLPHVGRHLLRTRDQAPDADRQLRLVSLAGAVLALLPLAPGMAWASRLLALWPVLLALVLPAALHCKRRRLPGSRRFLTGALAALVGVGVGIAGMAVPVPAAWISTAPLWGLTLLTLLVASSSAPRPTATNGVLTGGRNARLPVRPASDRPDPDTPPTDEAARQWDSPAEMQGGSTLPRHPSATDSDGEAADGQPLELALTDVLPEPNATPDARGHAETMAAAGRQLASMAENLDHVATPQHTPPQRTVFDLHHVLREAHDAVADRARRKGLVLSWSMAPHLAHRYAGDADHLGDVLRLLAESSVRATDKGSIHLSVRRMPDSTDPGQLLFTVSDSGAGSPPHTRNVGALARAWALADAADGTLTVESGHGQGTTISFTTRLAPLSDDTTAPPPLPTAEPSATSPGAEPSATPEKPGPVSEGTTAPSLPHPEPVAARRPLQVIVADGMPGNRRSLTFFLEGLPHTPLEARGAIEASILYRREPSGLVILDGDMPEDDIVAAATAIRAFEQERDLPPAPLLALVAHAAQAARMLAAGCTETLEKPLTRDSLRAAVERLAPSPADPERDPALTVSGAAECDPVSHTPMGRTTKAAHASPQGEPQDESQGESRDEPEDGLQDSTQNNTQGRPENGPEPAGSTDEEQLDLFSAGIFAASPLDSSGAARAPQAPHGRGSLPEGGTLLDLIVTDTADFKAGDADAGALQDPPPSGQTVHAPPPATSPDSGGNSGANALATADAPRSMASHVATPAWDDDFEESVGEPVPMTAPVAPQAGTGKALATPGSARTDSGPDADAATARSPFSSLDSGEWVGEPVPMEPHRAAAHAGSSASPPYGAAARLERWERAQRMQSQGQRAAAHLPATERVPDSSHDRHHPSSHETRPTRDLPEQIRTGHHRSRQHAPAMAASVTPSTPVTPVSSDAPPPRPGALPRALQNASPHTSVAARTVP